MIILAVQGSGKTYAASKRSDVADVDRIRGKESLDDYIARLYEADDTATYALGNARLDIATKCIRDGRDVAIFAPFKELMDEKQYQVMKERIFGRLVLRKEQTGYTCKYIEEFKKFYNLYNSTAYYKDLPGIIFVPMCNQIDNVDALIESGVL